jgi:hypothetical protein
MEQIGKIKIDQRYGIGQVPWNTQIGYMGFVKYMIPDEFLKLALPRKNDGTPTQTYVDLITTRGMGSPFLKVKLDGEFWQVTGHEGRHRMEAVKQINPFAKIPVHILPRDMRAASITDEMERYEFRKEKSRYEEKYRHVLDKVLMSKKVNTPTLQANTSDYKNLVTNFL